MSAKAKVGFFILALVSMALLAGASMLMGTPGKGNGWLATLGFVIAFILIYFGIYMRRKLLQKTS